MAFILLVSAAPAAATSPVVISQFRVQGGANDFVELMNVSNAPVTLPGDYQIFNWLIER